MASANGTVVVNGITDSELAELLEIKARHSDQSQFFNFNPQALQQTVQSTPQGVKPVYNNAQFSWNGREGFKVVQDMVVFLFTGEKAKAQGQ